MRIRKNRNVTSTCELRPQPHSAHYNRELSSARDDGAPAAAALCDAASKGFVGSSLARHFFRERPGRSA